MKGQTTNEEKEKREDKNTEPAGNRTHDLGVTRHALNRCAQPYASNVRIKVEERWSDSLLLNFSWDLRTALMIDNGFPLSFILDAVMNAQSENMCKPLFL